MRATKLWCSSVLHLIGREVGARFPDQSQGAARETCKMPPYFWHSVENCSISLNWGRCLDIIAIYIIFSKVTMKTVLTSLFFFLHFRRRFNILWCECWLWGNGIRLVIGGFGKNFELRFARTIRTFKHRCPSPRLDESKRLFPELKFMKASRVMWRGVKLREELLRILIRYME